MIKIMSSDAETIYERVAKLEDEIALLRSEVDIIKHALRNKIARHEIAMIKEGQDIDSIID
jgi:cell division protein FtsB